MKIRKILSTFILVLVIMILLNCCFNIEIAEAANVLDDLVKQIKTTLNGSGLSNRLVILARSLFMVLATIQIAWNFIQLAADGKTDMQSVVSMLIRQIIFIGFFYYFLQNGVTIFNSIIQGFENKGIELSGVTSVSAIFDLGLNTALDIIDNAWAINNGLSVIPVMAIVGIAAIITLLAFTTATLCALVTLAKTYISCTIGVYFLGFGGNSYTKDIAINAVKVCFMSGVEYFTIFLMVSIGKDIFQNLVTLQTMKDVGTYSLTFQVLVAAFIFAGCVKTIPGFVAGIVTGASGSAGAGSGAMASGMMAAAGAAVGAAMTGGAMLAGGAIGGANASGGVMGKIGGAITGAIGAKNGSIGGFMRDQGMQQMKEYAGKGSNNSGSQQNPNNVTP